MKRLGLLRPGRYLAARKDNSSAADGGDPVVHDMVGGQYAGSFLFLQARFTFDVVWPLVYGLFLVTAIGWLAQRSDRAARGGC